jgi:hypothetical protein
VKIQKIRKKTLKFILISNKKDGFPLSREWQRRKIFTLLYLYRYKKEAKKQPMNENNKKYFSLYLVRAKKRSFYNTLTKKNLDIYSSTYIDTKNV